MRSVSAIHQEQYLHLGNSNGYGSMGFRELEHMEELPCAEDIIMDIGVFNHRLIESIQLSEINSKISSAVTKKRKRNSELSQNQPPGPIKKRV